MVKNSGAETRSGAIKLLNSPEAIQVIADEMGNPVNVSSSDVLPARSNQRRRPTRRRSTARRTGRKVLLIEDRWRIKDEWWRGPDEEIERMYFSVRLENGHAAVVYQDLKTGCWYQQAAH